ncbi:hypothetical protein Pmar_PMAR022264 [Perkinsus marinus ATCC 50983]|uniref:Uncharacterized protein n=2 Tax=Perkinsus marinus (strain ATCC 50983 / TXsc) TaxID=423536 RepID=C5KDM4_PERM5|nr:hypothetical protein Pmar_PMAR022264 [Perkinsus marinus ATCC 50983]EER17327.1 hypothetical protein Pmar_PMAR022264 [Perkinsus marinus ATCC 50983]|eukprot:XP_002785531.1 hypothetical protein Pmar_PMAR022264 [Perkinsus marinus ATCC 50983]
MTYKVLIVLFVLCAEPTGGIRGPEKEKGHPPRHVRPVPYNYHGPAVGGGPGQVMDLSRGRYLDHRDRRDHRGHRDRRDHSGHRDRSSHRDRRDRRDHRNMILTPQKTRKIRWADEGGKPLTTASDERVEPSVRDDRAIKRVKSILKERGQNVGQVEESTESKAPETSPGSKNEVQERAVSTDTMYAGVDPKSSARGEVTVEEEKPRKADRRGPFVTKIIV